MPILPIPRSSGTESNTVPGTMEFLDDLKVKSQTNFYELNSNNGRGDSVGLPDPNQYMVKKKSNPNFGSTHESVKPRRKSSKNGGRKKKKTSKRRDSAHSSKSRNSRQYGSRSRKQSFNPSNNGP